MRIIRLRLLMVASVALGIGLSCLSGCNNRETGGVAQSGSHPAPGSSNSSFVGSLDEFYGDLASRVNSQFGGATPNFVVTQSPGAWAVGTVLRQNSSVPVSYAACRPAGGDPEVQTVPAPTLFPTYTMTRELGASVGLDDSLLRGLVSIPRARDH